jgi:dihydroorotate dehydrogenase
MYGALRPLLFSLEPERAHELTLTLLRAAGHLGLTGLYPERAPPCRVRLMGLEFPNRVGLAAGFDKNAACLDALGALGFGFVEVGTVTPVAQPGNPRPRVFRIPEARALINRMGFPNEGAAAVDKHLAAARYRGVRGINIGKNASTPVERAVDDYAACLEALYPHADYVAINVSSPNTAGLRELQQRDQLEPLLRQLLGVRDRLAHQGRRVPLLVKLSPDLDATELDSTATVLAVLGIDGVIATNSTLERAGVAGLRNAEQAGGLSGAPLHARAVATVRRLRARLGADFPIIGVGGITSVAAGRAMLEAGADLLQVYSGLVYEGPRLVRELARL